MSRNTERGILGSIAVLQLEPTLSSDWFERTMKEYEPIIQKLIYGFGLESYLDHLDLSEVNAKDLVNCALEEFGTSRSNEVMCSAASSVFVSAVDFHGRYVVRPLHSFHDIKAVWSGAGPKGYVVEFKLDSDGGATVTVVTADRFHDMEQVRALLLTNDEGEEE